MIVLNYTYKIKPTKDRITKFEHYLDVNRSVYNYALRERIDWLKSRKCQVDRCSIKNEYIIPADTPYPSFKLQCSRLTKAKKLNNFLSSVNAQSLQQTLRRLDKAWKDFLDIPNRGFPRFKSKNRFRSFVFPQIKSAHLAAGRVKLPSVGWVKIKQSRDYPYSFNPTQVSVVKKVSGYYLTIAFKFKEKAVDAVAGRTSVGIDAGIESFIATPSDLIKCPRFLIHQARKLKLLQRRLKKKKIGSNNWVKLQQKISRLHEQVANARKDWLFKLAHWVCDQADNVFVENINFKSWSRGRFAKKSLDTGIGGFINQILPYICWKRGKLYLKVDKNFTSQECPRCHRRTGKKSLSQREHNCQYCGCREHRDKASASVIQHRGELAVGHTVTENACGDDSYGDCSVAHAESVPTSLREGEARA